MNTLYRRRFSHPHALSALSAEKQPGACLGCKSCEAVCPQQIKISQAMAAFAKSWITFLHGLLRKRIRAEDKDSRTAAVLVQALAVSVEAAPKAVKNESL